MTGLETNVFPILNLAELTSSYRMFRILGLRPEQDEYRQNCQHLIMRLSYMLQNPVTIIEKGDAAFLIVRDSPYLELPTEFPLVRTKVKFESEGKAIQFNFAERGTLNDVISLRFLQFLVQEPLMRRSDIWRPNAGSPFFFKKPVHEDRGIGLFEGFSIRAVPLPDGGIGLSVDVSHRSIGLRPLPANLTRDDFNRKWKRRSLIYHYGHIWYRIQPDNYEDFDVSDFDVRDGSVMCSLMKLIQRNAAAPHPPEIRTLPAHSAVISYKNSRGEPRAAPTALCYPLFDTHDREGAIMHSHTLLKPHERRMKTRSYVAQNLQKLEFGDARLNVSLEPFSAPKNQFRVPDLEFGNGITLSVRGTKGARQISPEVLGAERLSLLRDKKAGFYEKDPMGRQIIVLPQSIQSSFGPRLIEDLQREVDKLFPQEYGYDPQIVTYDDAVPHKVMHQGYSIIEAVKAECPKGGFAAVMVHDLTGRKSRQEDELAALVVRELRRIGVNAAIMHSATGAECYELVHSATGSHYQPNERKRGRLFGYLRGVAINTVLLNNYKWPFVLANRTYADVTIGIDVKHNTAGLVLVGSRGATVRTFIRETSQKEKLDADQLRSWIVEQITQEASQQDQPIRNIVIHRDGRIFDSELKGLKSALSLLKKQGVLEKEANLTILTIPKQSPSPIRLYDRIDRGDRPWVDNPSIGSYYLVSEKEAYVCTTGKPFHHPGTVRPLHVQFVEGSLPLEQCLEDVYFLTALAWTRPEDCTRYPITLKLNDRYLGQAATRYNSESFAAFDPEADEEGGDEI